MNRRSFLEKSSMAMAGGLLAPNLSLASQPKKAIQNVGLGLFTLPQTLGEDFLGTLKLIAEVGYKELEFFGPFDFSTDSAKTSFNQMAGSLGIKGSGFFGRSDQEIKSIMNDLGLQATSMHLDWETLTKRMDQIAESAHITGAKEIGIAMIPQELRPNLDGYKKMAEEFNKVGEAAKKRGLTFHYHNHGYGHRELEGKIPFQLMLDETDPDLVKMEMDIFWFTAAGADILGYLKNNPGRFELFHIKDMTEIKTFANGGEDMSEIFGMFSYLADAGDGVLDICAIVDQAQKSGAKHFFVEKDMTTTPKETLVKSYNFLTGLPEKCL